MTSHSLPQQDLDLILERTPDLWEELRGQRIFLTGGTGFFGVWLLESLLAADRTHRLGVHVAVLTRDVEGFRSRCPHLCVHPGLSLLQGDVRNFQFPEGEYRYVIHAATDTWARPGGGGAADWLTSILVGTDRVLRFAVTHGTEKLLLTSSGAVYGAQPPTIRNIPESYLGAPDPLSAGALYGEGKRAAEALCVAYASQYGLACKIARCFAFAGPLLPLDKHFAIGNFIRDVLEGRDISINGDGSPRRSYMYAADLARWLWTILLRAPSSVAFNVGSAESVSILELAEKVKAVLGSSCQIRVAQEHRPGTALLQYVPDVDKAALELGLRCEISLEESIRKTAEWNSHR